MIERESGWRRSTAPRRHAARRRPRPPGRGSSLRTRLRDHHAPVQVRASKLVAVAAALCAARPRSCPPPLLPLQIFTMADADERRDEEPLDERRREERYYTITAAKGRLPGYTATAERPRPPPQARPRLPPR